MFFPISLAAALSLVPLAASAAANLDACMQDVLADEQQLRGRNAWAARCFPDAPRPSSYPEGDFVSLVGERAPTDRDAPCPGGKKALTICSGEGLLRGQAVHTSAGWLKVSELVGRDVAQLRSWDSRVAPSPETLAYSPLQNVVARPYNGPFIELETAEGAVLACTAGQPLLRANGTLVRADAVQWGDVLLGDEGVHHVERVVQGHGHLIAYQVLLQRGDFDHNVIDVGGLFVGGVRLLDAVVAPQTTPSP